MGTTNRPSHYSPGRHLWADTLLPFFNWFIRDGGYEQWVSDLTGTERQRNEHPFTWTYDPEKGEVHRVDREIVDGYAEETDVTYRIEDELVRLVEREAESALVEIRVIASKSSDRRALLAPYSKEVAGLEVSLAQNDELASYPAVGAALRRVRQEVNELATPESKPNAVVTKRRGVHSVNEEWIVDAYHNRRKEAPDEPEIESRRVVAEDYQAEFDLQIDESTIRRHLGKKR